MTIDIDYTIDSRADEHCARSFEMNKTAGLADGRATAGAGARGIRNFAAAFGAFDECHMNPSPLFLHIYDV